MTSWCVHEPGLLEYSEWERRSERQETEKETDHMWPSRYVNGIANGQHNLEGKTNSYI